MLPDVNVLAAAYRADHRHHRPAAAWLESFLGASGDGQRLLLPMPVVTGFVRLVTNVRIFPDASSASQALEFIDWLVDDARVTLMTQSAEWTEFHTLVRARKLLANAIPDAWLAAISLSQSEPFVTFDKGFRQLLPRSLLVLLPAASSA